MKYWYEPALKNLLEKLKAKDKVNGLQFLEDFVLEFREQYFENVELNDVDDFVSEEFDSFQAWLSNRIENNVHVGGNGKWSNKEVDWKSEPKFDDKFQLTEEEEKLLTLDALGLYSEKIPELKALNSKLASTNLIDLKYKCAIKLAKCSELSREILDSERIEFWLNASYIAFDANKLDEACEFRSIAAYHYVRISNHIEAAKSYEEAFEIVRNAEFDNKIQLLKNARIQYQLFGDHESASKVFYEEKKLEFTEGTSLKRFALLLYRLSSNYGESPKRVLCNCLIILIVSTLVAFSLDITVNPKVYTSSWSQLGQSAYYSVVTFTTLGYGDYYPRTGVGQIFAAALAILGLVYSSLFMVSVVRKYSRT
ncbi:potassium channel family protein [Aliikangiella sp. IMCC44632]